MIWHVLFAVWSVVTITLYIISGKLNRNALAFMGAAVAASAWAISYGMFHGWGS